MIYALPFIKKEEEAVLFSHRPKQDKAANAKEIAEKFRIPYKACVSDVEIDNACEVYLITGCGILSKQCLKGKRVLNAHPGIIPQCRGLDSFKWAILKDRPLGVTLHYIGEKVDYGEIVAVEPTLVYDSDTVHTLARRHYENEITMLANFAYYLDNPKNPFSNIPFCKSTTRMQPLQEKAMLEHFVEYKEKYVK